MKLLRQLQFGVFLLVSQQLSSQQITFNRVIPPLGSFSGFVGGIAQDKNGYMWFATQGGLFRYDGYRFKTYTHDPADSTSLAATHLETVFCDSKGMIWVATWTNGLDRLDPVTGKFTHFRHTGDPGSLNDNIIRAILEDHEGVIWIGTHRGLDRYDPRTEKFQHYQHDESDSTSLSCDRVRTIYEDKEGTLWIGTGSVFEQEGGKTDEGGLNRLDKRTGKFTRYIYNPKDPQSLINNKVNALFEDSQGIFWVGTAGDGLHTMDRATGKFQRHLYDPSHPEKLSRPPVNKNGADNIAFIKEDALKNIWIGTLNNGVSMYDRKTQKMIHYSAAENAGGFVGQSAWSFSNSIDGNFWIGTFEGALYRADPHHQDMPRNLTAYPVNAFNSDSSNNLWVGTSNGLIHEDRKTVKTEIFLSRNNDPLSLSNNLILSLYRDSEGILWIGTRNGLNRFNASAKNFTRYLHDTADKKSIADGGVITITAASKDALWIGTENGLDLMYKANGTFIHFTNNSIDSASINGNVVSALLVEPSGDLWAGLYNLNGLDLYDRKSGKFQHFLKNRTVTSLIRDATGTIWAGTDDGLYLSSDRATGFRKFYTVGGGLDIAAVLSIVEHQGKLWISSPNGIFKIDPESGQATVYASNYGVDGSSLQAGSGYAGKDGKLYFGDFVGYYLFSPGKMTSNSSAPRIVLTGFSIRGQPVVLGRGTIRDSSIESIRKISLRYDQNVFSFEFAGIHYSSPEFNKHLYKLENYDDTWHEAAGEKVAAYYNVPPGHYLFHIKAASSDGVWAEKTIEVTISSPWYETWWFRVLSVIAIVVVVYSIIKERSRKLKAENVRLEQKVTERTRQLQQSLNDLRSAQTQLVQSEKMASLGELTAGIAHEIQNPLNFVNNFSEVNKELIEELKSQKSKLRSEEQNEILNDIDQNLDKIYFHGKRADAIVKSMLQHSRTSSGQKELIDLNALVDEYLRLAYHGLRAKDKSFNATLKTEFDSSIERINIMPQEIGRVMLNLFNNAFYAVGERQKAEDSGYEPKVTVSTKKNANKVLISVADNGNGIPKSIVDKIFQPFFTTKPTGQGTGLGLSLAYDIVKAHGGEINVNSKEREGTEFIVQLPMA